ncbi:hypothetical protein M9H77_07419 [Catharanthus roseus]|uniref:Uncharacterized protein n=1 Tax=Catharanthus roseus TaxID=4058 RepID=A0ACC0BV56_CATRO|nr:hypothetical protein M9H77_07419 [Catharanthus roseus]
MGNEGSLDYKLYKTISFLPCASFLYFDFIINESNSCSFPFFCDRIQIQFLNFLTTTCGTKSNYAKKAKEEGMGKKLSIGYDDTSISLSLNPFCYAMKSYASSMTLIGNLMVNPFTCELALDVDRILKCSSPCVYFEKQLLVSVARIKPSYGDLEFYM